MRLLLILLLAISLQAQVVIRPISPHTIGGGSPPAGYDINDNFTSDAGKFVDLVSGSGAVVSGGVAVGENNYAENFAYYNTDLGSANHCVRADVQAADTYYGGLMFRVNPTNDTGYLLYINSGNNRVYIETYASGAGTYVTYGAVGTADPVAGTSYNTLVTISGSTINIYIDFNDDDDYLDTDEHPINNLSNATYSTGNYVGVYFNYGATSSTIDNLIGDASACTE